jgi:hypothetical protein
VTQEMASHEGTVMRRENSLPPHEPDTMNGWCARMALLGIFQRSLRARGVAVLRRLSTSC